MPDWSDPLEIQRDAQAFSRLMHAVTGVYAWEFIISLPFDWEVFFGEKRFRWPLSFYFLNRYLLLGAMCGILVALDATQELNCQALYTFNQFVGNSAAGLASINLAIRTMAIWEHDRIVVGSLIVIILGHWSLILQGILLKAVWTPEQGCVITETNTTILSATFIYTMVFDLIVLLLNTWKLSIGSFRASGSSMISQSRLAKMLFGDGLIYFLVAFLFNLLATIFMLMNLNPVMSIIFNVPAVVGSSIMALRAVRRLTNFASAPVELFSHHGSQTGPARFHPMARAKNGSVLPTIHTAATLKNGANGTVNGSTDDGEPKGIHVQMETFTREEKIAESDVAYLDQLRPDQYAIRELRTNNEAAGRKAASRQSKSPDSDSESTTAF